MHQLSKSHLCKNAKKKGLARSIRICTNSYKNFENRNQLIAFQKGQHFKVFVTEPIGVARGGAQGARAPPNQNSTNDKKL